MDPDRCLQELREDLARLDELDLDDAREALELAAAPDSWISRGGFLPSAWARGKAR